MKLSSRETEALQIILGLNISSSSVSLTVSMLFLTKRLTPLPFVSVRHVYPTRVKLCMLWSGLFGRVSVTAMMSKFSCCMRSSSSFILFGS